MILNAIAKQLTLKDDGQIYFQSDSTNPLAGEPIAQLVKGSSILQPDVQFNLPVEQDNDDTKLFVSNWMKAHLCTVLSPLVAMLDGDETPDVVRSIFIRLFQNLGIMKRGDLEDLITQLDAEQRKFIRQKKVKLGPILVFLPELNKPAAVRIRALLWALFNDKSLPAPVPRDGAVSQKIDPETAPYDFYQCIGYPVYADRAIRIDMVDRVMSAIYDSADKGKFRAQHSFAEWMGCGIQDMYKILEAMGHKRIEAPVAAEPVISDDVTDAVVTETPLEESVSAEIPVAETVTETAPVAAETVPVKAKPVLDEFFLRKGQAHKDRAPRRDYNQNRREQGQEGENNQQQRPFAKRNFTKPDAAPSGQKPKFAPERTFGKPNDMKRPDRDFKDRDGGGSRKFNKSRERDDRREQEPRVFSANAKTTDNPFAILSQLTSSKN